MGLYKEWCDATKEKNKRKRYWTYVEKDGGRDEIRDDLAETIRSLDVIPPSVIGAFVAICGELRTAGFSASDAVLAVDSVMDMTIDSAVGWRRLTAPTPDGPVVADRMRHALESEFAAHADWAEFGSLMAGALTGSPGAWWRSKLDLILDGIAVRHHRAT